MTWELYQSQSFLKATDLNKLFLTIYQTKLEVEEALEEEPVSTKVGKTILDTEKVDSQTAKTAIYESQKNSTVILCQKSGLVMLRRKKWMLS